MSVVNYSAQVQLLLKIIDRWEEENEMQRKNDEKKKIQKGINNNNMKETKNEEKDYQIKPFTLSTVCTFFRPYSGSNPCPSFHSHSSDPLRYRRRLLLSIALTAYANFFLMGFFVSLNFAKLHS